MSILDDAIREHLELKRAHGADEGELKKLEDEAFGPPQRPDEIDPFAEAPTEFLLSPAEEAADAPAIYDEEARDGRRPNITDLQEAPPTEDPVDEAPFFDDVPPPAPEDAAGSTGGSSFLDELAPPPPDAPPPSPADAADVLFPPPPGEPAADLAPPVEESRRPAQPPVAEEPPTPEGSIAPDAGLDAEERRAIADQPTQMFDVQAHVDAEAAAEAEAPADEPGVAAEGPGSEASADPAAEEPSASAPQAEQPTDAPPVAQPAAESPADASLVDRSLPTDAPPVAQPAPSDEELVDAAQEEPQAAPPAAEEAGPPTELYEQQPLDTRGPDAEVAGHPPAEAEPEEGSAEFDFFNEQRLSDELDQALEAPLPPTDEHLAMPQYIDAEPEQGGIFDFQSGGDTYEEDPSQEVLRRADEAEAAEEPAEDDTDYDPETGHEDVLEDTPRFLEDAPEDDDLWFEQKPPKDFDLD